MERKEFKIIIEASPEKVWHALWDMANYQQWTAWFSEGSTYETTWKEGEKVYFLDKSKQGMVSKIDKIKVNEIVAFKHIGGFTNGVEDIESPEAKEWAGALERYTLTPVSGQTELLVEQDIAENHLSNFIEFWNDALKKIKTIAEK